MSEPHDPSPADPPRPDDSRTGQDEVERRAADDPEATRLDSLGESPPVGGHDTERTIVDPEMADPVDAETTGSDTLAVRNDTDSDREATQLDTVHQPDADPDATTGDPDDDDPNATQVEGPTGFASAASSSPTVIESQGDSERGAAPSDEGATRAAETRASDGPVLESSHSQSRHSGAPLHETAGRWQGEQRYQLVTNFARGGLGSIWMAQDSRLRREVAYKELLPRALKNRSALERFLEEAQITGQLEHPGIVPVYDIGYQQNGTPFYAMKLVRGETFEKVIDNYHKLSPASEDRPLVFRRLLRHFIDICNALAFAHDRGVLHRDLKPLNVMVGAFGETLVLDWGLAKVIDTELPDEEAPVTTSTEDLDTGGETIAESHAGSRGGVTHASGGSLAGHTSGTMGVTRRMVITDVRSAGSETMQGSVMGTPAYMPPEQARGELEQMDARSDIYSLGGILYRLLTNQPPIGRQQTVAELLRNVIEGNIVAPRQHVPGTPRALEAICLTALANRKEDRHDSALKLAADVEAWLADEPVSVFADPPLVRARRWARRHPRTVYSTVTAVTALLLVIGGNEITHRQQLAGQRTAGRESITKAQRRATDSEFQSAQDELTAALARTGDDPELADLRQSISTQQELIENRRLQILTTQVETRLEDALTHIQHEEFAESRTELEKLATLLNAEPSLSKLRATVEAHLNQVAQRIADDNAIAETAERFQEFVALVDDVRRHAGLHERADVRDDAQLAIQQAIKALNLFDLNQDRPLSSEPPHFDDGLAWTQNWQAEHGSRPIDLLRESAFELLIALAEQTSNLAAHGTDDELKAAAEDSLKWLAKAEALGIQTQALLAWKSEFLRVAGREDEAEDVLEAASRIRPSTALDFFLLADADRKHALYDPARYEQAVTGYLQAQQRDPKNFWVHQYLGLCYLQLDQPAAALPCYSNCISYRPTDAWSFMMRGVCFGLLNQTENAMRDFSRAVELNPDQHKTFINRGAIYQRIGQFDDALADFATAARLRPASARTQIAVASTHFQKAAHIRDGKPPFGGMTDLKRAEHEQVEYDKALDALARASEVPGADRHPEIHQLRGRIYERQQNPPLAIASFQQHLALETDKAARAFSHKHLGFIALARGEFGTAQSAFLQADSLVPSDPETVFHLAESLLQAGENAKALQRYEQFAGLFKLDIKTELLRPELLFNGMALAHESLGRKQEAIEYYTLALMFNRVQPVPLTRRGWVYIQHAKELAQRDFEEAVQQNPDNPDTRIGLAFTLARQGDWERAAKEIETARPVIDEQTRTLGARGFPLYFNAATALAEGLTALGADSTLPDELRRVARGRLEVQTIELLRRAHALARRDASVVLPSFVRALQADPSLDSVRQLEGFQTLLKQARSGQIE